jgi:hypothetical protein
MGAPIHDTAFYRNEAAHCRRLAYTTHDDGLREELLHYAEEFDQKAEVSAGSESRRNSYPSSSSG